ncbi:MULTISPECIES: class I SAM-dependent methyltransferase [unclassified Bradyrhizobium]
MKPTHTDWNSYYAKPYKAASLTRRYTASVLVNQIRGQGGLGAKILELGGANSCFIDKILTEVGPARYDVIDSNRLGLDLLKSRYPNDARVTVQQDDVLTASPAECTYDIVFSVGLVEHFSPEGTARAIQAHFKYLRAGGTAIITFPTPTWLYRSVRALAEATDNWIFHDERPLQLQEFQQAVASMGQIESARILWPLVLTQYCVVTRKR